MYPFIPLLLEYPWVATIFVAIMAAIAALITRVNGDDWSTARRGGGDGVDVICPRCHHRTPPEATRCPECGKEL